MERYKTFTTVTDFGPYVTKLVLALPCEVRAADVCPEFFNVYVERKDAVTGDIIMARNFFEPEAPALPSKGYQEIKKAYPCDSQGNYCIRGTFVALELGEEPLGKRTEGTMLTSAYIKNDYRVTLLHPLPGVSGDAPAVSGLVFDQYDGDICPQLLGWANGESKTAVVCFKTPDKKSEAAHLKYGYFTPPTVDTKLPLVIWFHGAGEGGTDPRIAYTGNKVVNMSSPELQKKLGGAAWVLVPQCPTVWMDDGVEQLGHSNRSIYTESLKACIDEFIAEHEESIDRNRIYIGGCSNGGFMTVRMAIDYPDFFAAAFPACEAFFDENITDDMIRILKSLPIWLIHAKGDELVSPQETALPLYHRLIDAGADNVHFTYFNRMQDMSGMYRDELGRPQRFFNHGVWVHVYNDDCLTDFDGRFVMCDGEPVTLWEWLGKQVKEPSQNNAAVSKA